MSHMHVTPPVDDLVESKKEEKPEENVSWHDFTQQTTLHGVKYVFSGPSTFRRILWLTVVLGAVAAFSALVISRVLDYYKYQTVTSSKRQGSDVIDFPAVTLCNLNQFRITVAEQLGLFHYLDDTFKGHKNSSHTPTTAPGDTNSTADIIKELGHPIQHLIDNCWWQGKRCNISKDFRIRLLDIGLCFTFNSDETEMKTVTKTGILGGLQLLMNLEHYEHMRGPNMDSGVKFLLHESGEKPSLKDQGFVAIPGEHKYVSIKQSKSIGLEAPWGNCVKGGDSIEKCRANCFETTFKEKCRCTDTYMSSSNQFDSCTLEERFNCECYELESDCGQSCDCKSPCEETYYTTTFSSSVLSQINLDTFALAGGPNAKEITKQKFLAASESQVRLSQDQQSFTEEARSAYDAYTRVAGIIQDYSLKDKAFKHLEGILEAINEDNAAFSPELLKERSKHIMCDTQTTKLQKDLIALNHFYEVLTKANEAIETDPSSCNNSLWKKEVENYFCDEEMTTYVDFEKIPSPVTSRLHPPSCDNRELFKWLCYYVGVFAQLGEDFLLNLDQSLYHYVNGTLFNMVGVTSATDAKISTVQKHFNCLDSLEQLSLDMPSYTAIIDKATTMYDSPNALTIETFITNVNALYQEISNGLYGVNATIQDDIQACCWPELYKLGANHLARAGYDDNETDAETQEMMAFSANQRHTHSEFRKLDDAAYDVSAENVQDVERKMRSVMELMNDYSNGRVATKELSNALMLDPDIQTTLGEFVTETEILAKKLNILFDQLTRLEENFPPLIAVLHYDLMIPLLTRDDLEATNIVTYLLSKEAKDDMPSLINKVQCENKFSEEEGGVMALLEDFSEFKLLFHFLCSVSVKMDNDTLDLVDYVAEFNRHINNLVEHMKGYHDRTLMKSQFYTSNFLQVDLYYERLQFELVEEQKAFVLGSLFSEVGGFLGLLLGASVLTMCELLDYIVSALTKKKKENQIKAK